MPFSPYNTYTITPTVSTSAYASGDVVGTVTEIRADDLPNGGIINAALFLGNTQTPPLTLWFFDALPTATYTDNAAFAPSAADLLKAQAAVVSVAAADYATVNSLRVAQINDINRVITVVPNSMKLWIVIVAGGAFTFTTTSSLSIRLTVAS